MRSAFTLVEMLVVCLMLGILASLIIPKVVFRTDDARRQKAISDIQTLSMVLRQYRTDTGQYPDTGDGLNALRVAAPGVKHWRGPYVTSVPIDPWGRQYVYRSPGQAGGNDSYDLISYGSDGEPGGTGAAADISNADENP